MNPLVRPLPGKAALAFLVGLVAGCAAVDGGTSQPAAAQPVKRPLAKAAQPEQARDPWLWPYASDAPWNTPIGSKAQWSAEDDPATRDLRVGGGINAAEWSNPIHLAGIGDPVATIIDEEAGRHFRIRVPADAMPARGADAHLTVFPPEKRHIDVLYGCRRNNAGFTCVRTEREDACGDGMGYFDTTAGTMRRWEIEGGTIRHVLRYALPVTRTRHGWVWPLKGEDYRGETLYTGNVPYGSLAAIPPDVNVAALGLSPGGLTLARAMQDYGMLQTDTIDACDECGVALYAEPGAETMPQLAEMRADLPKLVQYLRIVTNQGPTSVGGGGTPRTRPAPPLDPAICPPRSARSDGK